MKSRIGFMQGRLVPMIDGKIQCFPSKDWRVEFERAAICAFSLMEWTLDQEMLQGNPLMTASGRLEINALQTRFGVQIPSLTGDCFMQAPFWKATGNERQRLIDDAADVADSCVALGIKLIVLPLVDNGSIENEVQADNLRDGLEHVLASRPDLQIAFESDFAPEPLARFIAGFPQGRYGINYDIGNSAALGYSPAIELAAYGPRVTNVHVKDRPLGGTTVPLGTGDADLANAIGSLERGGYCGAYILQTARASNGDDMGAACRYRDMTQAWIERATR